MIYHYTEGWTGAIQRTLTADGAAIDGTGLTVSLGLRDRAGALVPTTGNVSWLSQGAGTVTFSPASGDLVAAKGPYTAKWKATDSSSDDVFFPDGEPETWKIWL